MWPMSVVLCYKWNAKCESTNHVAKQQQQYPLENLLALQGGRTEGHVLNVLQVLQNTALLVQHETYGLACPENKSTITKYFEE